MREGAPRERRGARERSWQVEMKKEAKVEVAMEEEAKVEVCGERGGAEEVEMEGAKEPARRARGCASPRDSPCACSQSASKSHVCRSVCL